MCRARPFALASLLVAATGCASSSTSECESSIAGAVYCSQTDEGTDPKVPNAILAASDTVVASYPTSLSRVSPPRDMTTIVDRAPANVFPVGFDDDRICYIAAGSLECVPLAGGTPTVLVAGSANEQATGFGRTRSGDYVAGVSTFGASHTTVVRLDRTGARLGTAVDIDGQGTNMTVVDDDVYLAVVRADQVEIVRASLAAGGEPEHLGTVPRCSLEVADGVLYCVGDTIRTVAPGKLGEPHPFPLGVHALPGLGFVRLKAESLEALSPLGEVTRTLWQRPAGFDSESIVGAAASGNKLFVALAHWACTTVGRDKQSQSVCDDSHGKLEIVEASPTP